MTNSLQNRTNLDDDASKNDINLRGKENGHRTVNVVGRLKNFGFFY